MFKWSEIKIKLHFFYILCKYFAKTKSKQSIISYLFLTSYFSFEVGGVLFQVPGPDTTPRGGAGSGKEEISNAGDPAQKL